MATGQPLLSFTRAVPNLPLQARYQGGEEERSDLLRYYTQFRGRMSDVFDHLMCSDPDVDSHRLMDVINAAIQAGEHRSPRAGVGEIGACRLPRAGLGMGGVRCQRRARGRGAARALEAMDRDGVGNGAGVER